MAELLSRPRLTGAMFEEIGYRELGTGLTDRVFLIGHADNLAINDPYQVLSIADALDALGRDANCPLLRSLLEAFYAGARDIWLVAAAPMSEWVEAVEDREGADYYSTYYDRLEVTYSILADLDAPQIVAPLHAPVGVSSDFTTQLADFCAAIFANTGTVCIGLIGSDIPLVDQDAVDTLVNSVSGIDYGDGGKFVVPIVGSAAVNIIDIPTTYTCTPLASAAAVLSGSPLDRGLTYRRLPGVLTITYPDLTAAQVESLVQAKLNPMLRTTRSRRGARNEIVIATDNTLGSDGSDFWSVAQMRLVMACVDAIHVIGNRVIGTVGFGMFKTDLDTYFLGLVDVEVLRGFTLSVDRVPFEDSNRFAETIVVEVSLQPYFGIRQINFTTTVGPDR